MFKKMRRIDKQLSQDETYSLLYRGREGVLGTLSSNGYPYTVVLNYVYYNERVYFHCAKEGFKIDNINKHEKVSFSVYDNVEVVGEKLNTKYQSLILFGKAKVIKAKRDILMELIKKYSNIKEERANQMIFHEINDTAIIEIEIDYITGKFGN